MGEKSFEAGDQTWKTPAGGNLKDGTLKQWGDLDSYHKYLQKRIDELEKDNKFQAEVIVNCGGRCIELEAENKILREAVEFYADGDTWQNYGVDLVEGTPEFVPINFDRECAVSVCGYRARTALEKIKEF